MALGYMVALITISLDECIKQSWACFGCLMNCAPSKSPQVFLNDFNFSKRATQIIWWKFLYFFIS